MFLVDWFYGILAFLGLYQKVKEAKILVWGPHDAGKHTLLEFLRYQDMFGFRAPRIGKIKFKALDLESAGVLICPRLWRDYYQNVKIDAVLYLVDVADRRQLESSRNELDRLFEDDSLANVPFLIIRLWRYYTHWSLFNFDLDYARPLEINISTHDDSGRFLEGFRWLSQHIQ